MKITKWLSPSGSNKSATALIRVGPNEIADIEEMLKLVDGHKGHFGIQVELVKTGADEPKYSPRKHNGWPIGPDYLDVEIQFGFPSSQEMKALVRYYKVFVARD